MFNENEEDSDVDIYESDESNNDDGSNYDNFCFKNHLEGLMIPHNLSLFLLLFNRFFYYD